MPPSALTKRVSWTVAVPVLAVLLLAITVVVSGLTILPGRATVQEAGVHLVLCGAFLFLAYQPLTLPGHAVADDLVLAAHGAWLRVQCCQNCTVGMSCAGAAAGQTARRWPNPSSSTSARSM